MEFSVLLNQCSLKVKIYHNFIDEKKNSSSKVRKLKKGKCSKDELENELKIRKKINQSNEVVLCFSSSQRIDINYLTNKFRFFDIISIETAIIGRSSICNERILNRFSSYIENQLIELSKKYNQIHLLLSCSSALCLSIGQKIRVHELCPIYVYDFDKENKVDSRPWSLKLTE